MSIQDEGKTFAEFSFHITKASYDKVNNTYNWRAVASDTSPDLYGESMSEELFDDFCSRIVNNSLVPEPFSSVIKEEWKGGMPYLSIAHFKSGTNGKNVPGTIEKIYRDGNRLKATGFLHDTDMGRAVFRSLCEDLYSEKADNGDEGKIRISIGFLDLQHRHAGESANDADYVFTRSNLTDTCPMCSEDIGNKIYTRGQLVHLAMTRVPVNPRTEMGVEEKSMIKTKKADAESIIGKELADTIEEKSLVQSDAIVTKSDEEVEKAEHPDMESKEEDAMEKPGYEKKEEKDAKAKGAKKNKAKVATDAQDDELTYDEPDEEKREERRNRPAGERSLLQNSLQAIEDKVMELKSKGVPAETALREIQPLYSALGETVKKSLEPASAGAINSEISELVSIVKSLAETQANFQQSISTEIATLKAQVATAPAKASSNETVQRSIQVKNAPAPALDNNGKLSIAELAYRSTFTG